jgi:hypothetical protein
MAENSFVSIFGSGGGGGSAPASCCWIVQCGTGVLSTNRICATNVASGCFSTTFGTKNTSSGNYGVVSGGICNTSSGLRSTIVGGLKNLNNSFDGFVGGGNCNNVCNVTSGCLSFGAVVVGGVGNNTCGGTFSFALCCFCVAPTLCDTSFYSFVGGGFQNSASSTGGTISGGYKNRITTNGILSTISGGKSNLIDGSQCSTIGGGFLNQICQASQIAFIGGGMCNTIWDFSGGGAGGCNAIVAGGQNTIYLGAVQSGRNFIGGGTANIINSSASGDYDINFGGNVIVGGCSNFTYGYDDCYGNKGGVNFVGGGQNNRACGYCHVIVGGAGNNIHNQYGSFIGGGTGNTMSCYCVSYNTIAGGASNGINGLTGSATIGGGQNNQITNAFAQIGGGSNNTASGYSSTIVGGTLHVASACQSFIGGGSCQTNAGFRSTIGGGLKNRILVGNDAFIGGGNCNNICNPINGCFSYGAVVVGGVGGNTSGGTWSTSSCCFSVAPTINNAGTYSFVGGGLQNTASGNYSGVLGGISNVASCACSFVVGVGITSDRVCATFVNNLSIKSIPTSAPAQSGAVWRCTTDNTLRIVP